MTTEQGVYTLKNMDYNQDILPGENIECGFDVCYGEVFDNPQGFAITSYPEKKISMDTYMFENIIADRWEGGYVGEIRITNTGDVEIREWCLTIQCEDIITNLWNGEVTDLGNGLYEIKNPQHAQNIQPQETIIIGYQAEGSQAEMLEVLTLSASDTDEDTDGDGVLDGEEKIEQQTSLKLEEQESAVSEVAVSLACSGDIENQVFIENTMETDTLSAQVVGLVGAPIEIHSMAPFETAESCLKVGQTKIITQLPEQAGCGVTFKPVSKEHMQLGENNLKYPKMAIAEFFAINEAETRAVTRVSYDGEQYTMELKYYMFDYYDWDENKKSPLPLIADSEMYKLCRCGKTRFYENWGIYITSLTWKATSEDRNAVLEAEKNNMKTLW